MITVRELIERLEEMPPDYYVVFINRGGKRIVKDPLGNVVKRSGRAIVYVTV